MKRKLPSDNRLDWRDPEMPVIREYVMGNGETKIEVDPNYEHRYRDYMMSTAKQPDWRNDPTYNMRKPK